jgi:hypothetical protein
MQVQFNETYQYRSNKGEEKMVANGKISSIKQTAVIEGDKPRFRVGLNGYKQQNDGYFPHPQLNPHMWG